MRLLVFIGVSTALFLFSFLFCPNLVGAEITHPYTVDEKPRVMFADSIEIGVPNEDHTATTTYYGLENYRQDYINGYIHFTFTYTHARNFVSNGPLAYITGLDPRIIDNPLEKMIFPTIDISLYWYGETDWYLIDVQFDATGFTSTIKQAGTTEIWNAHTDIPNMTASDWVAIANRHPQQDEPYPMPEPSRYSMSFAPVSIREPVQEQTINPVIIIPGIMGSAKKNGQLVIDPILHTYDDLIATLIANGYVEGKDLFTFPYEWRDSNIQSANLLKDKINQIKQICLALNDLSTNCSKVDLVAHSMGGLVAREYIQSGQYQNDVDQVIFLGTPHKGSPKAYLQWEAGEFPPGFFESVQKQIFTLEAYQNGNLNLFNYIHNRPISSVQELLPTFDYLIEKDTGILRTYPNNYPQNTFLQYLNNDVPKLLNSGVKITNITGNTGNNTIEKIRVIVNSSPTWTHGEPDGFEEKIGDRGLERSVGDGTVTSYGSVLDMSISNEEFSSVSHFRLPRETSARIFNILTNKIANNTVYSSFVENLFSIQLRSPIDVVITAPDGKKMGKNFSTGEEYDEIADAFYSGFNNGDEEYITIPNPLDGEYKIEVQGTDNGGEYGVMTSLISDETSTTNEIVGITKPNQITELNTTIDNTSPQNLETERKITLDVLISDINGAYDLGWIKDKKTRDALVKQVNSAIKFNKKIETIKEKQPNGSIKIKKIEKFETKVNKILAKLFIIELRALLKKKTITQDAFDLIKLDVEYLINNN